MRVSGYAQAVLTTFALAFTLLQLTSGPSAVLGPGLEGPLLSAMKAAPGELPEAWALQGISVAGHEVYARYGPESAADAPCELAPLCVTLTRPMEGDEATGFFALSLSGDRAGQAEELVRGLKARLPETIKRDPWRVLSPPEPAAALDAAPLPPSEAAFRALLSSDQGLLERVLEVTLKDDEALLRIRTNSGPELVVRLTDRPPHLSNPSETTRSFHVRFEGGLVDPPDLPGRALKALKASDTGALRLLPAPTFEDHSGTWLHEVLWWLAALLIVLMLVTLPQVLITSARCLGPDTLVWGIITLGIALRLVLPGRMVELGIGVMLTDYAQYLIMPRYGPSVPALHYGLFQIFGADHEVVLNAHRVLGCLMLPIACAGGLALLGERRSSTKWLAPLWAFGLAFTPMLLRGEATESNLQPALFAFWFGLLAWLRARGWLRVVACASAIGFTMLARPELVLIAPAAWLLLCRPWREAPKATWAVLALLAILAPFQVLHVLQRTLWEVSASSLAFDGPFFRYHLWVHLGETALIEPRLAPLMTTLLALYALLRVREGRGQLLLIALGALGWIAVYAVDLSSASAPRLHVAGLQAWTLVASVGAAELIRGRKLVLGVLASLWTLSALATLPWLWAPTNEDTEARLIARLQASVEGESPPPYIATLHHSDAPEAAGHGTHRYFPSYRFAPDSVIPLGALTTHLGGERPVFIYQGVNCYAALDRDERGESGLLAPCAEVHERLDLETIWVEDVENYGNPRFQELGYYGDEASLRVGLWRVKTR